MLVILNCTLLHNQNDGWTLVLTCIVVLVVRMFITHSCEFTQKYQYSPNNLLTDFMNLAKRIFLFINCSL